MSSTQPGALTPESAYKQVANSIRCQIFDGTLEPGDQFVPEGALAEQHAVSRSTVREALRLLTSEHLFVMTRGVTGGSFAARPKATQIGESLLRSLDVLTSAKEISISELLEAREMLEVPPPGSPLSAEPKSRSRPLNSPSPTNLPICPPSRAERIFMS